ncbi:MAG: hypothetical protein JWM57_1544 [Phycisphaerales bacterium]|nr:hypothetical protein [Phycisphaerales bacterium]
MILIVDDDIDTRNLLLKIVALAGTQGHAVSGGYAALAWLEHQRPDLVILDVDMPDLSGLDVLSRIRSHALLLDLPVLIHTASSCDAIKHRAKALGASARLVKGSCSVHELIALIKSYVIWPAPAAA